jgi:hypothetical protein
MQTYEHQYLERMEGRVTGTESHENNEEIHRHQGRGSQIKINNK